MCTNLLILTLMSCQHMRRPAGVVEGACSGVPYPLDWPLDWYASGR